MQAPRSVEKNGGLTKSGRHRGPNKKWLDWWLIGKLFAFLAKSGEQVFCIPG